MYIHVYKSKADKKELNCNKNELRKRYNNILCFFYKTHTFLFDKHVFFISEVRPSLNKVGLHGSLYFFIITVQ